ncbi:DevR family CRISPR-associated autoregulator [Thermococcus sp. M39]|uniref:DevR family CRISPR-associated autoregulator n=1 Tax=unclassified Thermococcus TaxID=2627626 RepID=UPI0014393B98|nr:MULTISPECIES: DevR family CRISPR-associated autoregulator [unclassified Thermococcus]NJE08717.1 DevR family CRISPR-associated autoregulator [Thermococcus sp. M39]NJE12982.1 DevR family CRISPR-associated autoregulator [Thermococcus sp. LS2]
MSEKVFEIAILGRALWELHSLNNEGNVGNVVEPRSVKIIDPNTGEAVTTDGISGEMLKHIHSEFMWLLDGKENLCDACKVLQPERFNYVIKIGKEKPSTVEEAVKKALESCDICDVHGFMIEKPTVARKSTIEFGWALGIPEVYRDIHLHARHALGEKEKKKNDEESEEIRSQMIYHRPTRTGKYAIVTVFQPWRIGLNEARQDVYSYDGERRKERYQLALKAYQLMFTRPEGAMTTTRLPHVVDFEGVIVYSTKPVPVPVISPLKEDYKAEIKKIAETIEGIEVLEFKGVADFVEKIGTLLSKEPYEMNFGGEK